MGSLAPDVAKNPPEPDTDEQAVTAVAFDLQSMRVAMADTSGRMRVYDARSGDLTVTFGGAEDSVPVMCPQCKGRMQLPLELLGCEGSCPHCTKPFKAAAWSPRHSEKAFEEASKLVNDAEYDRAAAMLDDAIESQRDHYGAYFKAIVVRQQMAVDLASASDFRRAVDKLQEALGYFERARPWPAENLAEANQLAYDVAFSAAKLCRFNLSDTRRSQEFCNIAKTFFNTNEVEDMLVRLGQSDADTAGSA